MQPGKQIDGVKAKYAISPKDICTLDILPELIETGINSFKIEGRMKTEYYVANTVMVYRKALDLLQISEEAYRAALPQLEQELLKASHRAMNTGFFFGAPQPAAGANGFSQTMEYVARVEEFRDGYATVHLKNRFYVGDTLELLCPGGSRPFRVEQILLPESGESVETVSVAGQMVKIPLPFPAEEGDFLRGPNRNHQK